MRNGVGGRGGVMVVGSVLVVIKMKLRKLNDNWWVFCVYMYRSCQASWEGPLIPSSASCSTGQCCTLQDSDHWQRDRIPYSFAAGWTTLSDAGVLWQLCFHPLLCKAVVWTKSEGNLQQRNVSLSLTPSQPWWLIISGWNTSCQNTVHSLK